MECQIITGAQPESVEEKTSLDGVGIARRTQVGNWKDMYKNLYTSNMEPQKTTGAEPESMEMNSMPDAIS